MNAGKPEHRLLLKAAPPAGACGAAASLEPVLPVALLKAALPAARRGCSTSSYVDPAAGVPSWRRLPVARLSQKTVKATQLVEDQGRTMATERRTQAASAACGSTPRSASPVLLDTLN